MADKKLIEMVCTHNHGRSPLAEAFAKKYIDDIGLDNDINVISSGSSADAINEMLAGQRPVTQDFVNYLLDLGFKRDLFGDKTEYTRHLIETKAFEQLQEPALRMAKQFVAEEHAYRNVAFKTWELGTPKESHDQTIVRPDVEIILGMGKGNVRDIKRIYEGQKAPIIETLAGFALREPGLEFESAFGGSQVEYLEMGLKIEKYTHKSIDRIVNSVD